MQNNTQTHIFQIQVKSLIKTLKCLQSDDKYQALLFLISAIKLYVKFLYSNENEKIFKPSIMRELSIIQNVIITNLMKMRRSDVEVDEEDVDIIRPTIVPWNFSGKLLRSNLFNMIPTSSNNFRAKNVQKWFGNIRMNRNIVRIISNANFKLLFNMFEQNTFPLSRVFKTERRKVPAICDKQFVKEEIVDDDSDDDDDDDDDDERFEEIKDESNISEESSTNNTSFMLSSDTNTLDTNDSNIIIRPKQDDKNIFSCLLCDKSYRKRKSLVVHFNHHPGFCPDCGKHRGTTSEEIIEHNKNYHKDRPHICDHCGETFTRNQQYQVHIQGHFIGKAKVDEQNKKKVQKYSCKTCDISFNNQKYLEKHVQKTKHQIDGVVCELCGAIFISNIKLCQHMIRVHKNEKRYTCEHCSKEFSQRTNLDRHLLLHTKIMDKSFICEHCGSSYFSQTAMREHIKTAHTTELSDSQNEVKFECNICNKFFAAKRSLKRHKLTHSEERAYPCTYENCKESYKNQSHLTRHQKSAHNLEAARRVQKLVKNENGEYIPLEPVQEPKPVKKKKPAEKTVVAPEPGFTENVPCYNYDYVEAPPHPPQPPPPQQSQQQQMAAPPPASNFIVNNYGEQNVNYGNEPMNNFEWQNLEQNLNNVMGANPVGFIEGGEFQEMNKARPGPHFINNNPEIRGYQENVFICEHCDESFLNSHSHQNHVLEHYNKDNKDTKKMLKLNCRTCSLVFSNHIQLEKHVQKTNHQIDGLVCEFCSAIFMTTVKLSQHLIKSHKNETWHTCEHCSKIFIVKADLDRHLLLHATSPDKSNVCDHCGSAFFSQDALKEHIKVAHASDKKYECDICSKLFAAQRSLKRHRLSHAEDGAFPCPTENCKESFKNQTLLAKHRKMMHVESDVSKSKKKGNDPSALIIPPVNNNNPNMPCYGGYDNNLPYNSVNHQFAVHSPSHAINANNYGDQNLNYRLDPNSEHYTNSYGLQDNSFEWQNLEMCNPQANNIDPGMASAAAAAAAKNNKYYPVMDVNAGGFMNVQDIKNQDPQQLMEINNQEFLGYQDIWNSNMVKIEYSDDVNSSSQVQGGGSTYNSIGNILTNLELIGNNSNFEQNFDIVTSHSIDPQKQHHYQKNQPPSSMMNVDNNLVNHQQYFQDQHHHQSPHQGTSQQMQYNNSMSHLPPPNHPHPSAHHPHPQHPHPHPQHPHSHQQPPQAPPQSMNQYSNQDMSQNPNHTITDISKTNNLQFVDSFTESIDYLQQSFQFV